MLLLLSYIISLVKMGSGDITSHLRGRLQALSIDVNFTSHCDRLDKDLPQPAVIIGTTKDQLTLQAT